jgi:hypothetical protein
MKIKIVVRNISEEIRRVKIHKRLNLFFLVERKTKGRGCGLQVIHHSMSTM